MSAWDETTKERVRELVAMETTDAMWRPYGMELDHLRLLVSVRKSIGMVDTLTATLEGLVKERE